MNFNSPDIYKIIDKSDKIAVSAHLSPDGDAVGSCVAMAQVLEMLGKKPVILLEEYSKKFNFLKGLELIKNEVQEEKFDLFIALDCGSKDRLSKFQKNFDEASITMNIDHHISNTNFAQNNIVYPDASSTCEVVYEVVKNFAKLNKYIAEALYTGILTDTNGFMHNSTSPRTHEVASELLKLGISSSELHTKMLYSHSISEMRVFGYALTKAIVDGKICYCLLTNDEIVNKCGADYTELENIVSYLLNCNGVEASAFIYEKADKTIKVSLRSIEIDVSLLATKFGGGGHKLAAGVSFNTTIEKARDIIINELKETLE